MAVKLPLLRFPDVLNLAPFDAKSTVVGVVVVVV